MVDRISEEQRSWNMSRIQAKNTEPEIIVRKFLHSNGYRYGLHNRKMPGKPDIVLRKYNTVIFVNVCYWHRHGCKHTTTPKTNTKFWKKKFDGNVARDKKNHSQLYHDGWKVIVIWECEVDRINILESLSNDLSQ
jgi:DNA mismatch endonuclease (patch repair protein)